MGLFLYLWYNPLMTIKALIAKRNAIEADFNQQAEFKATTENTMAALKAKYELLNELIEQEESKKKKED